MTSSSSTWIPASAPPDTRTVTATIVQGTPAASPTDPALTQTETHYQLVLFRVRVGAAVTSIVHTALTDRRAYSVANNTATVAPWLLSDSFASPPRPLRHPRRQRRLLPPLPRAP